MSDFCALCNLFIIREPTRYKNVDELMSIDHILTNHPRCFQLSCVYEAALPDFRQWTSALLKMLHSCKTTKKIRKSLITLILGWLS